MRRTGRKLAALKQVDPMSCAHLILKLMADVAGPPIRITSSVPIPNTLLQLALERTGLPNI